MKKKVSIIGAGVVGTTVGYILNTKGYEVVAIAGKSQASLVRARSYIKGLITTNIVKAASLGDVIFITTQDDQIENVCKEIAHKNGFKTGDMVLHMSGALSIKVLKSADEAGACIASIHPIQSFADIDLAIKQLPGTYFGVTAGDEIWPFAFELVKDLGGEPILVKDEDKSLYHAAACVTSNYLVALLHFAQEIYSSIGISQEVSIKAIWPLVEGTLKNIKQKGTSQALTGPIARGDLGTIEKHLSSIKLKLPEVLSLYEKLGNYTVDVALKKGSIDEKQADKVKQLLDKE
ncbi:DUF2520 domain-containing protein [Candidatus Oleimmundimicrobium sp.]|uniref:Rossmann-like and DUF2520 domain-containing protein n=1 Tax=Candidatus Oleimmundimicrobium sp. TaxID=3060597 RepID=UPI00271ED5BC|nr:DUF2520 domain-containing protein [Candidatus Oleimmundimicrobium sp.]MDO8885919.1 DUF2520 domain-containing protein [Candidatus Oleimmundimicrobium sp.]